jgi:hypothetical protein
MSQQLSRGSYAILLWVNMLLVMMAAYSVGRFYAHSKNLDYAMLRLDLCKQNRSKILEYMRSNCSQLIVEYPEFYISPHVKLCEVYGFSLKLGKVVVVLSILYDIYLLHRLFGLPPLPLIIMGAISTFLFYITFTNNECILQILESFLIVLGCIMIPVQYSFPTFDEHVKQWLNLNNWLSKNKNSHIYDCIHKEKNKHQD